MAVKESKDTRVNKRFVLDFGQDSIRYLVVIAAKITSSMYCSI